MMKSFNFLIKINLIELNIFYKNTQNINNLLAQRALILKLIQANLF